MKRVTVWLLIFAGLALSCAISVPPSGGPEDKQPPEITGTEPADGATNVPVDAAITFTFSEKMAAGKIERLLAAYPPFEMGKVEWKKNSLRIHPAAPLRADTTYWIMLKPGFRDQHNVENKKEYSFAFATGAHVDSGTIAGTVIFRRKPSASAIVRAFALRADTTLNPASARPDREAATDDMGHYEFRRLPTSGVRFLVWAFQDQNDNDFFEPGQEFAEVYPDTIILSASAPAVLDASIIIIDPTEPGDIKGTIINASGNDTFPVSVAVFTREDSLPKVAGYAICGSKGGFHIAKVKPGAYGLVAFLDLRPDSLPGTYPCPGDTTRLCDEPYAAYPDSIRVKPGDEVVLPPFTLSKPEAVPDEN
jgi:hypothetical protein